MLSKYLDDQNIVVVEDEVDVGNTNGNISPAKTSNSPTKKELTKRPSDLHNPLRSTVSESSSGREQVHIHQVTCINSENGLQFNYISKCKLNDPSLIQPTSLEKLKTLKPYLKISAKRDKELEILNRKHEKRKSKHKELKQTQGELFVEMCKDQFKAELDIHLKFHSPIYDTMKMLLEINHKNHMQQMQETFEKDSEDLKKEMETKSKLEMKNLAKNFKDKNELGRRKREAQNKHVTMVVNEIEKLKEILKQKNEELAPILAKVKQELEKEREEKAKELQEQYEDKCRRLTDQFHNVGLAKECENTPL